MKNAIVLVFCLLLALPLYAADNQTVVMQKMSAMPLAFTQNNGQWPDSILFSADADLTAATGMNYLEETGIQTKESWESIMLGVIR